MTSARVLLTASLAAALLPAVAASQDPIGLTLYVQPWDIATDTDTPVLALDSPSLVSDAFGEGWAQRKGQMIDDLKAQYGAADRVGPGFTLYEIDVDIDDPELAVRAFSPGGAGPLTVLAESAETHFRLTSSITVPSDLVPRDADPRCSIEGSLTMRTEVTLGTAPDALFSASNARIEKPVELTNLRLDHHGVACAAILAFVDITGFEDALKQLIVRVAEPRILAEFDAEMAATLAAVNGNLAALIPQGLGRTAAYFLPGAPGQRFVIVAGVLSPVPDTSPRASIAGTVRGGGAACEVPLRFSRKVGPRPVDALGQPGAHPLEVLTTFATCGAPDGNGVRAFTVQGLSSAFPNYVDASGFLCGRQQNVLVEFPAGPVERILPGDLGRPIDIALRPMGGGIPCAGPQIDLDDRVVTPQAIADAVRQLIEDPFPIDQTGDVVLTLPQGQVRFSRTANLQALNPQPLPPDPGDAAALLGEVSRLQRIVTIQQSRIDALQGRIGQ